MDVSKPYTPDTDGLFGDRLATSGVCDTHGAWESFYWSKFPNRTTCPRCVGDAQRAKEAAEAEANRAAAAARRISALESVGVGPRHLGKTLDSFIAETAEQRRALEACRALVDGVVADRKNIPSLILSGAPGTGKTHLTCAIVQACYDAGRDVLKVNVMDIVRAIKASWRKGAERDEEEVIESAASRDLLIIDEIGVQFGSDTERMYVFEIINRRYERCLPTVLISNLDMDSLKAEVGERVIDRMREDGGKLLVFTGASWRKQ